MENYLVEIYGAEGVGSCALCARCVCFAFEQGVASRVLCPSADPCDECQVPRGFRDMPGPRLNERTGVRLLPSAMTQPVTDTSH